MELANNLTKDTNNYKLVEKVNCLGGEFLVKLIILYKIIF